MALKPDRRVLDSAVEWFMNATASPGYVVVASTSGSGVQNDAAANLALIVSNPSGYKPIGMLTSEVVNIDTTLFHVNFHKDQVNINNKVSIVREGWLVTNAIIGTPAVYDSAYLSSSGNVTPTLHATGGLVATPLVGKFYNKKDEDGYAKVSINLN